jgi:outer membrane protein assembly factor BamA
VLLDGLDRVFFGSTFLRGYPAGSEVGDRYLLLTAEYRMPLVDIFGGPSMVPLFVRRLKLAAFTDWGQAKTTPLDFEPDGFRRSAGAEVITETTLGWRLLLSMRLGYAHGFDDDGEEQIYFFLGNWF